MANVDITPSAESELDDVPAKIRARVMGIIDRLAEWPNVSGAKPLRGNLAGNFRIRTGYYRIVFRPSADGSVVVIWKIGHRGSVYD